MAMRASRITRQHRLPAARSPYSKENGSTGNTAKFGCRNANSTTPSATVSLKRAMMQCQKLMQDVEETQVKQDLQDQTTLLRELSALSTQGQIKKFEDHIYHAIKNGKSILWLNMRMRSVIEFSFQNNVQYLLPIFLLTGLDYLSPSTDEIKDFFKNPTEQLKQYTAHYQKTSNLDISPFFKTRESLVLYHTYTLLLQACMEAPKSHSMPGNIVIPERYYTRTPGWEVTKQTDTYKLIALSAEDVKNLSDALAQLNQIMESILLLPTFKCLSPEEKRNVLKSNNHVEPSPKSPDQDIMDDVDSILEKIDEFSDSCIPAIMKKNGKEITREAAFTEVKMSYLNNSDHFSFDHLMQKISKMDIKTSE